MLFHILQQSTANVLVENLSCKNYSLELKYKISVFWCIYLFSIQSALDVSNYTKRRNLGFKSFFPLAQHG